MKRALLSSSLVIVVIAGCARSRTAADDSRQSRPQQGIITAEDIERSPGVYLEQLLVARVPGLRLARAVDGRVSFNVRGPRTIMSAQAQQSVLAGLQRYEAVR